MQGSTARRGQGAEDAEGRSVPCGADAPARRKGLLDTSRACKARRPLDASRFPRFLPNQTHGGAGAHEAGAWRVAARSARGPCGEARTAPMQPLAREDVARSARGPCGPFASSRSRQSTARGREGHMMQRTDRVDAARALKMPRDAPFHAEPTRRQGAKGSLTRRAPARPRQRRGPKGPLDASRTRKGAEGGRRGLLRDARRRP
jgi:hypothetical protein